MTDKELYDLDTMIRFRNGRGMWNSRKSVERREYISSKNIEEFQNRVFAILSDGGYRNTDTTYIETENAEYRIFSAYLAEYTVKCIPKVDSIKHRWFDSRNSVAATLWIADKELSFVGKRPDL